MRLIDADALKEALSIFNDGDPHFLNGIKTAREIIDDLPSIDAIPLNWIKQRKNETWGELGLDFELNCALFRVGVEWERWKKDLAITNDSLGTVHSCQDCSYSGELNCSTKLIANALELLKEQEATYIESITRYYSAGCEYGKKYAENKLIIYLAVGFIAGAIAGVLIWILGA